jgi:hypothetical protein
VAGQAEQIDAEGAHIHRQPAQGLNRIAMKQRAVAMRQTAASATAAARPSRCSPA